MINLAIRALMCLEHCYVENFDIKGGVMKKVLFIDDEKIWINLAKRYANGNPNIISVECHSVEEALQAIDREKPSTVFLDNSLTRDGNEGLEIADRVKGRGMKIYSTTVSEEEWLALEYEKRGIRIYSKLNFSKIWLIVTESLISR